MMKNLIKTFAFACIVMGMGTVANAQQKIAFIYSDSLIMLMPDAKQADSMVQVEVAKYEKEMVRREEAFNKLQKEYSDKVAANNNKEGTGPLWELQKQELQEAYAKMEKLQQDAQAEIPKIRQKEYEPIIIKARKAIEEVAKEKGYTYVLDASVGAILYSQPANNIMEDVKKKLGIK